MIIRRAYIALLSLVILSCEGSSDQPSQEYYEGDSSLSGFTESDGEFLFGKVSLPNRISPQSEFAEAADIILDEWIAIGHEYDYSIMLDYTKPFGGKPSLYFEMTDDPTTEKDETEGRCEVSYNFTTEDEFYASDVADSYEECQVMKTVDHYGGDVIPRDMVTYHRFSVNMPEELDLANLKTIFAQWHGMPDRTLVRNPEGEEWIATTEEFMELCDTMVFEDGTGYDIETGEVNDWRVDASGSYPPLTFGFQDGYFYVKANSDKKWISDEEERCFIKPGYGLLLPKVTEHKETIMAYLLEYDLFPKDCWVTFTIAVTWSQYSGQSCEITRDGALDVVMEYGEGDDYRQLHIVDNETLQVGRNDANGYYFKYGIYRSSGTSEDEVWMSTFYNVAGYSQWI